MEAEEDDEWLMLRDGGRLNFVYIVEGAGGQGGVAPQRT